MTREARRPSSRRRKRVRGSAVHVALALLAATLIVSPQLLNGAYGWGASIIAGAAAATAIATWIATRGRRARTAPLVWLSLCALLWTAFQLVPLPREIIALLQPRAIEAADDATRLLDSASRS